MSDTTTENGTDAPNADKAGERTQPSLDEIQSVIDELGLTPGQIKGRLEASRKWEDRAKEKEPFIDELKAKAARLDEIEEANKSEQQKLAEAAEVANKNAAETAVELAKLRAAVKHGLNDEDLELLGTGTPEEIESRAERLAARLKGDPPPATPSSDGQGKQGEPVSAGVKQLTREDLKSMTPAQIEAAHEAGQLNAIQGIQ